MADIAFEKDLAVTETGIGGLKVVDLAVHGDSRGWFKENWQRAKMCALGIPDLRVVQNNISYNDSRGVTRGIHAEPWDKFISVARGSVFGAWVDLREGSETFGKVFTCTLDPSRAIYVPRGVGNSFQALEDGTAYTYLVDAHWSPELKRTYTFVNLADPELAIERAIEYYRRKGYTEDWISQPLFSIRARKNLTFEWRERGVKTNSEYAILTNDIYHAWSDLTAREYKTFKGLANESLRDNMSDLELALSTLAEATTAEVERATDPESLPEHREVARSGGEVAGIARKAAEKKIGGPVITSATAPDFGRLIMEVIEVQAIEEEGDALNADAAE